MRNIVLAVLVSAGIAGAAEGQRPEILGVGLTQVLELKRTLTT